MAKMAGNTDMICSPWRKSSKTKESVTSIGSGAFSSCYDLTEVIIPASVTSIGNEAFCHGEATIYGEAGSEAQRYAEENGFPFKAV